MDKDKEIIHLEITSFSGYSIGATHYYGKLIQSNPYITVELKKKLTSKEAKALNKADDWDGFRTGSLTERFDTKEEVIEVAVKEYKKYFLSATTLLLGNSAAWEPKKVLDGDIELMMSANKLWVEYKEIPWEYKYGFYDLTPENRKKADELTVRWENLFNG